ncbi:MAG: aldo/keto reductase [Bacilli bacterium]|nr:aldo/keto reductase [Bacilli bacterium]
MFENVLKNFGFGCMRLPMNNGEVNLEEFQKMVDYFLENGFNYFDTATGYLNGLSELALKSCLTSKYPRDKYFFVNKLSPSFFETHDDLEPYFNKQLESCGVEYFDLYLMHAQNANLFKKYQAARAYEFALEKKALGKVKHFGISFHDTPEVLDNILTSYPEIEVVQLQFNYLDYENPNVQSKRCYEVCVKHNKKVIVMEPVKGGTLVNLTKAAQDILTSHTTSSNAGFAIRFAASFENVKMVLSGMSNFEQVVDNINHMKEFKPLSQEEFQAAWDVVEILKKEKRIACTECRYCVDGCPKKILIPDLFKCYNNKNLYNDWNSSYYYNKVLTVDNGLASSCIKCGKCEQSCPQHLPIRELLESVAEKFEKK